MDKLPLQDILQAARLAAESIMSFYNKSYQIYEKSDKSPVTDADLASHKILTSRLPSLVDLPLLSEESANGAGGGWRNFWLIDPLDGTKGFIKKNAQFTINVAIIEATKPVFGLTYLPVTNEAFYASRGSGAFKLAADGKSESLRVNQPEDEHKIISSPYSRNQKLRRFSQELKEWQNLDLGSALKFTLIASGAATVYPRFSPSCWWDTAAGQCLVEEAGGRVMNEKLQPLSYEWQDNYLNPPFIAYAYDAPKWCDTWLEVNREP